MEKINLLKPKAGWSSLRVQKDDKTYDYPISNIEDSPNMLLNLIINVLSQNKSLCAEEFDAEGWDWIINMSQFFGIMFIAPTDDEDCNNLPERLELDMTFTEFAKSICHDFRENLDEWSGFCAIAGCDEEELEISKEYKAEYTALLEKIESLLR